MPPNISDGYIMLKPRSEWPNPKESLDELRGRMQTYLATIPGYVVNFHNRLNSDLMNWSQVCVVMLVKIFGDDMIILNTEALKLPKSFSKYRVTVPWKLEQTSGLPLLNVEVNLWLHNGLSIGSIQDLVATSIGGQSVGEILEGVVLILLSVLESKTVVSYLFPSYYSASKWWRYFYCLMSRSLDHWRNQSKSVEKMVNAELWFTTNVEGRDLGSFVSDVQTTTTLCKWLLDRHGGRIWEFGFSQSTDANQWFHWFKSLSLFYWWRSFQ